MAKVHINASGKILLLVVAAAVLIFGVKFAGSHGWIPAKNIMKALIPEKATLQSVEDVHVDAQGVTPIALPSSSLAKVKATLIRMDIWEWNAQLAVILANGGASTTKGSIMEKQGVNLLLHRQDATGDMVKDLVTCANELSGVGVTQCSGGANIVIIMGDGGGQFAASVNPQLAKLGPQYLLKAIAGVGYSRGEDAFMASPDVKVNPENARGILVEGVLRDGDWNIALKWAGDNNIPNNPTEGTYDPTAINWVNAPDYNTAAADYVTGKKCPTLKVVRAGRPTGETKQVCVNALVTWTPGDVTAVTQRGGLVKVVSSEQYKSQMPATVIGPGKFLADNSEEIVHMLAGFFQAGDQIKVYDESRRKAAILSSEVYNDEGDPSSKNGDFWYRYYKGVNVRDSQGLAVKLGGSSVNNLDDNLILFGIKKGSNDNFRSTYNVFAKIDVQQYPDFFKETPIPDISTFEDKSYILRAEALLNSQGDTGTDAVAPAYEEQASGDTISHRSYQIQFDSGKATLTPEGVNQLRELKDELAITGLFIQIDGYTDNTGNEEITNKPLSIARAQAVKSFLQRVAPDNFPNKRFAVTGYGSKNPASSNSTSAGKKANRRVEITQKGN